jgi:1-deoxy-D-xylulose-5-phosphate reductoisomerase
LADWALEGGGSYGAVMNGANEAAVAAFVQGKIRFGQIARVVERTIESHQPVRSPGLADLMEADRWARCKADEVMTHWA